MLFKNRRFRVGTRELADNPRLALSAQEKNIFARRLSVSISRGRRRCMCPLPTRRLIRRLK